MGNKTSDKYLLWTYFGIDGTEDLEKIIAVAMEKAYLDATRQGSFNTRVRSEDRERIPKSSALNTLSELIQNTNTEDSYSQWHSIVCDRLVEIYGHILTSSNNPAPAFTYGNAQKLVNMTIKDLYVIAKASPKDSVFNKWYNEHLLRHESEFHIPIDNYVLQYLYNNDFNDNQNVDECGGVIKIKEITENKSYYLSERTDCRNCFPWSKIATYDIYQKLKQSITNLYSDIISNYSSPIEWETDIWTEIARLRNAN